jgi:hypothetical protein
VFCGAALLASPSLTGAVRIGVVAIQNHSTRKVPLELATSTLEEMLRKQGFATTALAFQPPADVQYAARQAKCDYILYSEVVRVTRPAGAQMARAMQNMGKPFGGKGAGSLQTVEAEVEFRLFGLEEVLPDLSTTVQGKTRKDAGEKLPSVSVRLEYIGTDAPAESTPGAVPLSVSSTAASSAVMDPAKISALTAAFEKTAKSVRAAVDRKSKPAAN